MCQEGQPGWASGRWRQHVTLTPTTRVKSALLEDLSVSEVVHLGRDKKEWGSQDLRVIDALSRNS